MAFFDCEMCVCEQETLEATEKQKTKKIGSLEWVPEYFRANSYCYFLKNVRSTEGSDIFILYFFSHLHTTLKCNGVFFMRVDAEI